MINVTSCPAAIIRPRTSKAPSSDPRPCSSTQNEQLIPTGHYGQKKPRIIWAEPFTSSSGAPEFFGNTYWAAETSVHELAALFIPSNKALRHAKCYKGDLVT